MSIKAGIGDCKRWEVLIKRVYRTGHSRKLLKRKSKTESPRSDKHTVTAILRNGGWLKILSIDRIVNTMNEAINTTTATLFSTDNCVGLNSLYKNSGILIFALYDPLPLITPLRTRKKFSLIKLNTTRAEIQGHNSVFFKAWFFDSSFWLIYLPRSPIR